MVCIVYCTQSGRFQQKSVLQPICFDYCKLPTPKKEREKAHRGANKELNGILNWCTCVYLIENRVKSTTFCQSYSTTNT